MAKILSTARAHVTGGREGHGRTEDGEVAIDSALRTRDAPTRTTHTATSRSGCCRAESRSENRAQIAAPARRPKNVPSPRLMPLT
jgi:hypothetical protein